MTEQVLLLPLDQLKVHPLNPRRDVGDVDELAASIRSSGVLEPIIVVPNGAGWYVVAGSRRLAASRKAERGAIPAIVRAMSDEEIAAAAAIENLQRKDLTPLEEAECYREILKSTGWTQEQLGKRLGRAQSTIANALRLLKAPAPIQEALRANDVGAAHGRELLRLEDDSLFGAVKLEKGITVRELQARVDAANRRWRSTGAPAIAAAQSALAAARAEHPKFVITWRKPGQYQRGEVLNLVAALGKAPSEFAGEISEVRLHDGACECRAYELAADYEYRWQVDDDVADLKGFEVKRACIDRRGHAAYQAARRRSWSSSAQSYAPKKKTPAQLAKERAKREREFRETVGKILAGGSRYGGPRFAPANVEKILIGGGYTSEKATRVIYLSYILERVGGSAELLAVVRKALTMKERELRALILRFAAHEVSHRLLSEGKTTSPYDGQVAAYEFLRAYGQKAAEPKRKERSKKKATARKRRSRDADEDDVLEEGEE